MSAPSLQLSDTHCHLILPQFDPDRSEVIEQALQSGVRRILVPGIDLSTSRQAVELAKAYEPIFAAVGVHPHQAGGWSRNIQEDLLELARSPKVVAIGEIGLDHYRGLSSLEDQERAFTDQLRLASELELPVVIHNRDAILPLMQVLEQWVKNHPPARAQAVGVLHAYSAPLIHARRALELGFLLGVGGPITYKNAEERRAITRQLPPDRLLIETDAPYLAPHPHRGRRNEPGYVGLIAKQLSQIFDLDLQSTSKITFENAVRLFDWVHDD